MTNALKADVGRDNTPSASPRRDRTVETVCMALALASAAVLIRAVSLW